MIESMKAEAARLEQACREQASLIANAETQLAGMRATFEQLRGGLITVRNLIQQNGPAASDAPTAAAAPPNGEIPPPPVAEAPQAPAATA